MLILTVARRAGGVRKRHLTQQVLCNNSEWKAKLDRSIFSDDKIAAAIQRCYELFATQGDTA